MGCQILGLNKPGYIDLVDALNSPNDRVNLLSFKQRDPEVKELSPKQYRPVEI